MFIFPVVYFINNLFSFALIFYFGFVIPFLCMYVVLFAFIFSIPLDYSDYINSYIS